MRKILAIDDSEINLELLKQVFKIHYPEFKYLQASTGSDGIKIAKNEKPEIILLDILMPELSGYEVCERLKSDPSTQHIPVLMISALGQNTQERIKGLNVGADAFISKPFSQAELRAQVNVALRIRKVEDLLRSRNENLELFIKGQTNKYLQNEQRFLQISEHAGEFYWEVDAKGDFTYVSPVVEKTLQLNSFEIIGKKDYLEVFQLNKTHHNIEIKKIENQSFNDLEIKIKVRGSYIWLSVNGFSIFNKNGDFAGKRGVCYDITKRKQAEIALKENVQKIQNYQKRLKSLNKEITLVQERERRRIAENLHDSLGQTLSLAFLKLSSIDTEDCSSDAKKTLYETSDLINIAISESRSLTYDLSPPILYELGLIPAIKWKLEQIEEKKDIKTYLIGEDQKINLDKDYNIFIYRIVCELFANTIKHAKANSIEVEIIANNKICQIIVSDNGVGFNNDLNTTTTNSGFGLLSITERLDSIQGKIEIESEPNKGTKAIITIPFNKIS